MQKYFLSILLVLLISPAISIGRNAHIATPKRFTSNPYQQLTPPSFHGGKDSLFTYIFGHLEWPKTDDKVDGGALIISFFVEKDGSLTGFVVEQSFSPAIDAKAIDLLRKSPKWIPAKRDGTPIRSHYKLPIRYHVETEDMRSKDSIGKQ